MIVYDGYHMQHDIFKVVKHIVFPFRNSISSDVLSKLKSTDRLEFSLEIIKHLSKQSS